MVKANPIIISGALSGLLLSLSQPIFGLSFFVFFGLLPLFFSLKNKTAKAKPFLLGYIAGLVYFLFALKWFWSAYPLKHIGVANDYLAFLIILLVWLITAGVLALAWGLGLWFYSKVETKISWPSLFVFPSVWALAEYLRAYFMSLLWVGQGSPVGPHWTVGNLAYNLHNSFLALKLSSWIGIYGISFLIVLVNVLVFIFLNRRFSKKLTIVLFLVFAAVFLPNKIYQSIPRTVLGIRVAVVQTKIPSQISYTPQEQTSLFKTQLELLDSAAQKYPDTKIVVFPEGSNFFQTISLFRNTFETSLYFDRLFPSSTLIVDSSKIYSGRQTQSKTIYLDSKNGVIASYDKYLLMPGGEYVPKLFLFLDKILGLNSQALKSSEEFAGGEHPPLAVRTLDNVFAGALVCSDISSPTLARELGISGANIIISQSSMGFVNGSASLIKQDLAFSKFRAAENGKYMIKANNYGNSYIISSQGLIIKKTGNSDPQILTGEVVLNKGKTLYNKAGDWPILLASLGVLIFGFFWKDNQAK